MKNIVKHTSHLLLQALFWTVVIYFGMPRFSLDFPGMIEASVLSALIAAPFFWTKVNWQEKRPLWNWIPVGVASVLTLVVLVGNVCSSGMAKADAYRALITVTTEKFSGGFDIVDPTRARVVTEQMAQRVASVKLGEHQGLSSRATIGAMDEQKVGDSIFWVAPLEHISNTKAWQNVTTSGYVMVSSSNEHDVRLVEKNADGTPIKMAFTLSAVFGRNVERLVYNAFPDVGAEDFTFEIDDAGKPYIVATLYENKVVWGGADPIGVAVVDVQTGAVERFGLDKIPAWIDRVVPSDIAHDQLVAWGDYVDGWVNSWLSGNDIVHPSDEATLVYGKDGRTYWYFDARGNKSTNGSGATGHFLVDSRTKKAVLYSVPGSAHEVAARSIEGAVQQMRYHCGRVLPYMAHGELVYMGPLLDASNLRKGIGIALYADPSVVGTGETVDEALRALKKHMSQRGHELAPSSRAELAKAAGKVRSANWDGGVLYITLDKGDGTLPDRGYAVPADANPEVRFTAVGDSVSIGFELTPEPVADVVTFDNVGLSFGAKPTRVAASAETK